MGFWSLEDTDMHKPAYLVPQIFKFTHSKTTWADIINFKRHTHIFMLILSIPFGCAAALSGIVVLAMSLSFAIRSHAHNHVAAGGVYALIGIFLLYVAVRVIQSCAQLLQFLRQSTGISAE